MKEHEVNQLIEKLEQRLHTKSVDPKYRVLTVEEIVAILCALTEGVEKTQTLCDRCALQDKECCCDCTREFRSKENQSVKITVREKAENSPSKYKAPRIVVIESTSPLSALVLHQQLCSLFDDEA